MASSSSCGPSFRRSGGAFSPAGAGRRWQRLFPERKTSSRGTARRDRTLKLRWYRQYGVRECWLVDPARRMLTVLEFVGDARPCRRTYRRGAAVRSAVLPRIRITAAHVFA